MKSSNYTYMMATILVIMSINCKGQDQPGEFDYGRIENNVYSNSYFNMEMTLPAEWIIQSKEQVEELTKTGKELVAGDDESMKTMLEAAEVNTANLFAAYQFELGSPVDYNPSIMLIAENIRHAPGVKNGGDYLYQARKVLLQSQLKYDHIDEQFEIETVGGMDFYKMNCAISYMGLDIKQVYYSTILKGFSLVAVISFINDEQKKILEGSIHSVTFDD